MPDDLERLSAYLDNALSAADRSALEERLATDDSLRTELENLRQTVQTLRAAPELAVPRNFTLDPAKYRRPSPWWTRYQRMQMLASFGTAAAILLIALGFFLSRGSLGNPAASTSSTVAVAIQPTSNAAAEADKANEESTLGAAQRSVISETPMPSMTNAAVFSFSQTSTSLPTSAPTATDQQAAQDGAAIMANPSETPMTLNAVAPPLATATSVPPMMAATGVYKSATLPPATTNRPPPTESNASAGDGVGDSVGGGAPIAPPTLAVMQATPQTDNFALTLTPLGTTQLPVPQLATMTLASPNSESLNTATALPTATSVSAQSSVSPNQSTSAPLPLPIIIGVPLLVFCLMLLGIVWLRSRMR